MARVIRDEDMNPAYPTARGTRYNIQNRQRRHWKNYKRAWRIQQEWAAKAERSYAQWAKAEDELYEFDKLHGDEL